MSEKIPFSKEEKTMLEKHVVDQVRKALINSLKEALKIYGPDWVNKETCAKLIEDLEKKRPTKIRGPFYGDYLDAALSDLGIRSRDGTGRYEAIWKELEKGEEVKEK